MSSKEQQIEELLTRGVAEVIDREHLKAELLSGKTLRVKLGIDPTSPNIHLGRSVPLLKLRDFQRLGHKVIFIVGDFTGVIGDTSDKESERPILKPELVKENMKAYLDQVSKILDTKNENLFELFYNSTWLEKEGYFSIGEDANQFSLAEFIARENIQKRLESGKRVSLREVLYPLMQGRDSVEVEADVELGGTDQRFNLLAGRRLQEMHHLDPQDILMTGLILGTDGRKMSSSWGNTINLLDSVSDMFGKVMSIPDELIAPYLVHCTRVSMEEVERIKTDLDDGSLHPRDAKIKLAKEIVTLYHSKEEADKAEQYFIDTFSKGQIPEEVREVKVVVGTKLVDVIAENGLAESKSDARRKIEQGGVEIAEKKVTDPLAVIEEAHNGQVMKVGKKDFVKLVF